jgi:hypothetical protein
MAQHSARALKIEWLAINQLNPDPRNPKQHGARQIRQIADSIKTCEPAHPARSILSNSRCESPPRDVGRIRPDGSDSDIRK